MTQLVFYLIILSIMSCADAHPDAFPNQLTPADPALNLVDAAFYCNVGIPPLLRDHRCMDLILTFNYSWDTDQFEVCIFPSDHQKCIEKCIFKSLKAYPKHIQITLKYIQI